MPPPKKGSGDAGKIEQQSVAKQALRATMQQLKKDAKEFGEKAYDKPWVEYVAAQKVEELMDSEKGKRN